MKILAIRPHNALTLRSGDEIRSTLHPLFPAEGSEDAFRLPPVAYAARAGDTVLEMDLQLPPAAAAPVTRLTGHLENGLQLFSGEVLPPLDDNRSVTVAVRLDLDPAGFVGIVDESVLWQVGIPSAPGTTVSERFAMEMYFLPKDPSRAFPRGIPPRALRYLAERLTRRSGNRVSGRGGCFGYPSALNDEEYTVAEVIQLIFDFNPPRYDIVSGAPHFITTNALSGFNAITLDLDAYLAANEDPDSLLNCYDTASVAQVLLEAIGEGIQWIYMEPFGYLRQTDLIGRGTCNNPFYGANGTQSVVATDDPERTAFANHAFVFLTGSGTVGDPCNGPHLGNESLGVYIDEATDDETPNPPAVERGTINDITVYIGVTDVIYTDTAQGALDSERLDAFLETIEYEAPDAVYAEPLACRWQEPQVCPALGDDWEIVSEGLFPGIPETHRNWRLRKDGQSLNITVFVATDTGFTTQRRFLTLGSLHQSMGPIFEKGPDDLGEVSARYPDGSRIIWTHRNIAFDIRAGGGFTDLEKVARWLQELAEAGKAVPGGLEVEALVPSSVSVRLGELLTVDVQNPANCPVDWTGQHGGFQLLDRQGDRFTFKATDRIQRPLVFVATDPASLLSRKKEITVPITP